MSPIQFARAIAEGRVLRLFNHGEHQRDFTYIDDIVESIVRLIERPPQGTPAQNLEPSDPSTSHAPWRIYNIGGQHPVALRTYVALLEKHLGQAARIELLPLQPGDVLNTCADASDLARATGFRPRIELDEGLGRFVDWFLDYYALPGTQPPLAAERAVETQRRSL
jgi:UDP-glucuronate 4-epimerase